MPKNVTDILTKAELDLLHEVINSQADEGGHDIVIADMSKQLLHVLAQADDIVLIAQHQLEVFRFPLYLVNDGYTEELKELGPPEIIDHNGGDGRYWRLSDPQGLKIFDPQGEKLLGVVMNISTSGLFMLCNEQQFSALGLNLQEGDSLCFYLKIPQRGFHLVDAKVVRIESEHNNGKGLALKFDINSKLALILHNYIIDNHDSMNE